MDYGYSWTSDYCPDRLDPAYRDMSTGESGVDIVELQQTYICLVMQRARSVGVFGRGTEDAVRMLYQKLDSLPRSRTQSNLIVHCAPR